MKNNKKEKRIEIRVSNEDKSLIEQAAALSGISLSSYMLLNTLKQAKLDISLNELISLDNKDRDSLIAAFSNPPEPNKNLKDLLKK